MARLAGVAPAFADLVVPDDCWVGRTATRPAVLRRPVGQPRVLLPRHARRSAPRCACARADRPRPAGRRRRCCRACSRPRSRPGSASSTPRPTELPELDHRPARAEGRVPLRRRPLDPPVGAAPRLRASRVRGRPRRAAPRRPRGRVTRRTRIGMDVERDARCCTTTSRSWPRRSPSSRPSHGSRWRAEVGVPLQPLRSPEEALHDPAFLADGCVTEVVDPDVGRGPPGRHASTSSTTARPTRRPRPGPSGADTDAVRAEADALDGTTATAPS